MTKLGNADHIQLIQLALLPQSVLDKPNIFGSNKIIQGMTVQSNS